MRDAVRVELRADPATAEVLASDDEVVLDALRTLLAAKWVPEPADQVIAGLGDALSPLLPAAAPFLTGSAAETYPQRDKQILAARITAAVQGPERVLPTVQAILAGGHTPARHAAALIASLGAIETIPALEALLAQDDRFPIAGGVDDVVWADELFQEHIRDALRHLRAG
ncbi:hypothetical protein [Paractinoplanes deccanensis]|uniref:hypothetical protein n=1 Tax=Paractinoplanes deccanensis TaxID=113561 RepID=UPI001EF33FB8|nr:hypothetical protein [Actinoplanes deccanensis]